MKISILIGFYLVLAMSIVGQSFQRFIGGSGDDHGHVIVPAANGGYFITGQTTSFGQGQIDLLLIKMNPDHSLEWVRTYGTSGVDDSNYITVTEQFDGTLLLTSSWEQNIGGQNRGIILKLSEIGEIIWSKRLTGTGSFYADGFGKTIENSEGEIVLVGTTQSVTTGNQDGFLARISQTGEIIQTIAFGGNDTDHNYNIWEVNDGYLIRHGGKSFSPGVRSAGLAFVTDDFEILWYKRYGENGNDSFWDDQLMPNGDIMCAGFTDSFGSEHKGLLTRISASGELLWAKTLNPGPGSDRIADICLLNNNGYVISITSASLNKIVHVLMDENDEFIAAYSLGGNFSSLERNYDSNYQLSSGFISTVGLVNGLGTQGNDLYQILYDPENVPCEFEIVDMEVEDVNLETTNPSIAQTQGGNLSDFSMTSQIITNDLSIVVECEDLTETCDIQGMFEINGYCQNEPSYFDFQVIGYTDSELNWSWYLNGNYFSSLNNPEILLLDTGTHSIEVYIEDLQDSLCSNFFDTTIVISAMTVEQQDPYYFSGQYGENINLNFPQGLSYQLDGDNGFVCSDCNGFSFQVTGSEELLLTYTNEYGCSNSSSVFIETLPCENIWFPNVFSPNQDGFNDYFKGVINQVCLDFFELTIYNRWGQAIYESLDPEASWDGSILFNKNSIASSGTYYWVTLYGFSYESEIRKATGSLTLIR